jgi:hypothetical protein
MNCHRPVSRHCAAHLASTYCLGEQKERSLLNEPSPLGNPGDLNALDEQGR